MAWRYLSDKRHKSMDFARPAAATLPQVPRPICALLSMASRYSVARAVWLRETSSACEWPDNCESASVTPTGL